MALPTERGDREYQKFVETDQGYVAVRVQGADINGLDPGNSSTVELPKNTEFIGTWLDATSYEAVQVSLLVQNKGTLYLEWATTNSATATDAAEFSHHFDIIGGQEYLIRKNHRAQYYRTRYLNNGFAQTAMILQTFQGAFNPPDDAVRLRDAAGNQAAMVLKDGNYRLMTADPTASNLLGNIHEELIKLNEKISNIME